MSDALEKAIHDELLNHEFIPGKFPDPDYCSCGHRWGLYTKGDARMVQVWHVAEAIAELAAAPERT